MNVVVAIDSLKGSLTSLEAGHAIRSGILQADPTASVQVRPLADGGEGTVDALTSGLGGTVHTVSVTGPLGETVPARYGILDDGTTAVIETAAAAGITLVPEAQRNPLYTTTFGVGEMIRDAIEKDCRHFIVGIGGSSTNDGGAGMLQALGFGLLTGEGQPVPFGARGLAALSAITVHGALSALRDCSFRIACDVANPLYGPQGASAVYGPQKGADGPMAARMDGWLRSFSRLAQKTFPQADAEYPGTGAAGGLGFAFLTFTNAVLEPGVQIVLEETRLEEYIRAADIVVTGEGRLDGQTVMGKAPFGVAQLAKKHRKPVIAFAGCVTEDAGICNRHGIDAFFPILRGAATLQEAMDPGNAKRNMADTAEQVFRLLPLLSQAKAENAGAAEEPAAGPRTFPQTTVPRPGP